MVVCGNLVRLEIRMGVQVGSRAAPTSISHTVFQLLSDAVTGGYGRTLLRFSLGRRRAAPLSGLRFNLGRLDSGAKFVVGLLSGYSGLAEAPKRAPPPE